MCDRCDAFYCTQCDEMDQCEDCSEVVCGNCSTLMSCKFCGCGLCEDCATACGRCGIVLCARDAKFAVECDTCKMSYCLVCLASGEKDPCVRCGCRPSKRVEQLVHLRLKSIYKAFKSSAPKQGEHGNQQMLPGSETASSAAQALKRAAGLPEMEGEENPLDSSTLNDLISVSSPLDPLSLASTDLDSHCAAAIINPDIAGDVGAVLAAAALAVSNKHSNAAPPPRPSSQRSEAEARAAELSLLSMLDKEDEVKSQKAKKKKKKAKKKQQTQLQQQEETERLQEELLLAEEELKQNLLLPPPSPPPARPPIDEDTQLELELNALIEMEDTTAINELLESVKGVPGKSVLRKTAKKALKRFKDEEVSFGGGTNDDM